MDFVTTSGKYLLLSLVVIALTACGEGGGSGRGTSAVTSGNGTAELSWLPPTTYTDGTVLSSLEGHNIYVDSGNGYRRVATVNNAGVTNYLLENLSNGTYRVAVTAYDSSGIESSFSNEVIIRIG